MVYGILPPRRFISVIFRHFASGFQLPFPAALHSELNLRKEEKKEVALWAKIIKNPDASIGPLVHLFARTTHSFACSAQLASLTSLTPELVGK